MNFHIPTYARRDRPTDRAAAFTLVELLTVIAIVALLVGVLLPALTSARRGARSVACRANLSELMIAIHMYATENGDTVVPSYNMKGVATGVTNPLDGWAAILDRDHFVPGRRELRNNPFACPDTLEVAGMASTQTGVNPDNPRGYMEWPAVVTISSVYETTIPAQGFDRVLRVAYWINADNPIGIPSTIRQGIHFTGSVGYGPDPAGKTMLVNKLSSAKYPSKLIALADGLYSGKQGATRLGDKDSRVGFRHLGAKPTASVAFADGHVGVIAGDSFPRRAGDGLTVEQVRDENFGVNPTVYADPEKYLLP